MKKKVIGCSIIIAVLCVLGFVIFRFSTAKKETGSGSVQYMLSAEKLASGEGQAEYLYFDKESLVYAVFPNNIADYYRYYFDREENVFLGSIPNFYTSGRNGETRLGNGLYFFAGLSEEDSVVNRLFRIDLRENTLEQCSEYKDQSLPTILTYPYKDEIVTLKNIVNEDGSIHTFLDFYHPEKDEWTNWHHELEGANKKEGAALYAFYAAKESLYVIRDEHVKNGEEETKTRQLIQYDGELNQVKDCFFEGEIQEFAAGGRLIELSVSGDLIYLRNTSDYGYLGILRDDHIETIMTKKRNLRKVYGESEKYGEGKLFLRRKYDALYWYDEEAGQLIQISLNLNEGESLQTAFVSGDYIMLICYARDSDNNRLADQLYVMPLDSLLKGTSLQF